MVGFSIPGVIIFSGRFDSLIEGMAASIAIVNILLLGSIINQSKNHYALSRKFFEITVRNDAATVLSRWGVYVIAVCLSIAAVAVPIVSSLHIVSELNDPPLLQAVVLGLGVAYPAAYPLLGVGYQIYYQIKTLYELFSKSRQISVEGYDIPSDLVEAELRVYDDSTIGATGISIGKRNLIFFSEKMAEELDDKLFHALLAHEDAHATKYSDGFWGVFAAFVAGLTLVGQNILYAALDFPSREIRADQHAAEKTTPAAIKEALEKIYDEKATEGLNADPGPSIAPQHLPGSSSGPYVRTAKSRVHQVFRLFYGGYTMDKAHPMIETRKAEIDKYAKKRNEKEE